MIPRKIEIPFGASNSELCGWEYTIPEGMEAEIRDGKVIVRKKESDDERIRKNCIHFLELQKAHHADTSEIDDCIAYLEKQKAKEKYDRTAPIYKDKDSFEDALDKAWKFYNDSGSSTVDGCEDNAVELAFAKGFREGFLAEKQKEQKSIISVEESLSISHEEYNKIVDECIWGEQKEQKPAECLKPERDCWYVCIKDFYAGGKKQSSNGDLVQAKGGMYMMGREDISEWFRKAYYDELKPAEWSEEDEYVIDKVLNWAEIVNPTSSLFEKLPKKQFIARLKSLRPQPHWKPSEEQMNALWGAAETYLESDNEKVREILGKVLESLYNDLKKL